MGRGLVNYKRLDARPITLGAIQEGRCLDAEACGRETPHYRKILLEDAAKQASN